MAASGNYIEGGKQYNCESPRSSTVFYGRLEKVIFCSLNFDMGLNILQIDTLLSFDWNNLVVVEVRSYKTSPLN